MRIYLVRHGDAIPEEQAGSDRDRWLSLRGREASRVLGRLLREHGVAPDVVLASPLPPEEPTSAGSGTGSTPPPTSGSGPVTQPQ